MFVKHRRLAKALCTVMEICIYNKENLYYNYTICDISLDSTALHKSAVMEITVRISL